MPPAPLFKPFRALGYITEDRPFVVQRRGKETFVTVSVGRTWQVYNCAKLTLVLVGPQLRGDIRALACSKDFTFAAVGKDVVVCKRVHRHGVYAAAPEHGPIVQLLALGDVLLVLHAGGYLVVWDLPSPSAEDDEQPFRGSPRTVMRLGGSGGRAPAAAFGVPTCMAHPDTYLNKVLVGAESGQLQLWNFASGQLLHTFGGWGSAVRTLCSSPALDVVGVGLTDGRAVLHNVRFDETLASFVNAAGVGLAGGELLGGGSSAVGAARSSAVAAGAGGGACSSLSFRTGGGLPLMAAGGGAGVITVWNLEERKLHCVLRDAHDGPLLSLHFFAGEPLLMSSAADNSIKHWLFDGPDEAGRLLRFRSGHSAPPTCVLHYGQGGQRLLSAGRDRAFRVFSVIQDQQSRELSQRPGGGAAKRARQLGVTAEELKLARLVGMAAGEVRERDWSNVITAHEGDPTAYVWRLQHFTIGEHRLRPPAEKGPGPTGAVKALAPVTSVALSPCGNFGIVGSAAGRLDRYNMQSGNHRGTYWRSSLPASQSGKAARAAQAAAKGSQQLAAHEGAVVGVAVDSCNRLMVSGGTDRALRVWDFKAQVLVCRVPTGSPLTHLHMHPGSALCATAADDLVLRLFDIEAGRLVRRFRGHTDRVTSLQLSADSRWLLSASMDGSLRVWDVPAARCLQAISLGGPPVTCLSLSPAMDLLATTHSDRKGVYLWANQAVFGNPADILPSEEVVKLGLPRVGEEGEEEGGSLLQAVEEADSSDDDGSEDDAEGKVDDARRRASGRAADAGPQDTPAYDQRDSLTGAPIPLAPELVTLSMLPASQWQSLVHLETIKARNKPIEPPKKPESAPFFLPTVPGLSGNPTFDAVAVPASASAEDAAAAFFEGGSSSGGPSSSSRVIKASFGSAAEQAGGRKRPAPAVSPFLVALRAGADGSAGFGPLVALLRGMSASAIDRELRAMQVLEGSDPEDHAEGVRDLATLLEFLACQLQPSDGAVANFEFCQGLMQLTLQVHGDSIMQHAELLAPARRLQTALKPAWQRVDGLMQGVRCMVSYFGNLQ